MSNIKGLTLDELYRQLKLAAEHRKYHAADFFEPVPRQKEFVALTADKSESMLMAGNGCGKTETAAYMLQVWMTGKYPEWWNGYRFPGPVQVWAAGTSAKAVREACQTKLLGKPGAKENMGTGMVPKDALVGDPVPTRGVADSYDSFQVRHASGGISRCVFKTYEQSVDDWQGADVDVVWFDEEPPTTHYMEGQARRRGKGRSIMTFTPLKGRSEVVTRYLDLVEPLRGYVKMGINHALWYTPEQVKDLVAAYLPHEIEARMNGEPLAGEGKVYTTPRTMLENDPLPVDSVPAEWPKLWGIDFGYRFFAAVLLTQDPARKHYYVLDALKIELQPPAVHASAMKRVAANVPVAWPHDGHHRDGLGTGLETSKLYASHGLVMLNDHATHRSGGYAVFPGIRELDDEMRHGRFHVDSRLVKWFNEYDQYHIEDNKIVKENDHLMDATRVAWMMFRKARAVPLGDGKMEKRKRPTGRVLDPHTGKATLTYR